MSTLTIKIAAKKIIWQDFWHIWRKKCNIQAKNIRVNQRSDFRYRDLNIAWTGKIAWNS